MRKNIFYRPKSGVCADFIPFYDNDEFYLYFLRDYRDIPKHGEGTPWQLIMTKDFIDFSDEITVLERGSQQEQDLYVFTGSVIKDKDNVYHIFYTGHNPHLRQRRLPEQAIMHAISSDGIHFTKLPEDTFFAPLEKYDMHDWRDPFVYYDESTSQYIMLFAARLNDGAAIRRGCTGKCSSKDLKKWKVEEPLWAPKAYFTHECPDYFTIGDWHYLIYSEFSDHCKTRYRMSKDSKKWIAPKEDSFDGRAYYAAKSTSDGTNRYLFGWIPTKAKNDNDSWNWGGSLAVHEIYQVEDGTLRERMPKTIEDSFGKVVYENESITLGNIDGTEIQLFETQLDQFYLECDMEADDFATKFGVLLSYDDETDNGYVYAIDRHAGHFNLQVFPNQPWNQSNFVNVYRKYEERKTHKLQVLFEDQVCVAYLDGKLALSGRLYPMGLKNSKFGLLVCDGNVCFKNIKIKVR